MLCHLVDENNTDDHKVEQDDALEDVKVLFSGLRVNSLYVIVEIIFVVLRLMV